MNDKPPTLADFLESERKERNITSQRKFADEAGIDPKTMNRMFNGHIPDPEQIVTMAQNLKLDPLNLLAIAYLPPAYHTRKARLSREIMNLLDIAPDELLADILDRIRFEFNRYLKSKSSEKS